MEVHNELQIKSMLDSSVGQKMIIALSGSFLIIFVLIHLIGNSLLYVGSDAFNYYTYSLTKNKFILYFMEIVMIIGFGTHIFLTYRSTRKNQVSRDKKYQLKKSLGMSTIFSSNMGVTGSLIFIFLVIHIRTFKFGSGQMVDVVGVEGAKVIDMYNIVTSSFQETWYSLVYIVAMVLVGGHMSHGIQSAFRSLGFYKSGIKKYLNYFATVLGLIVGGGFASIPIYFGFLVN